MATYIPNATQTTEPVESRTVESAALEFRTLKTSINARIEDVQDGLDTEIVNRIAGDVNLQTQNNAQDIRLLAIENALLSIGEGGLPGTVYVQRFSGTGAQTAFTLNAAPQSENVVDIYINGIYQNKDTFSVAGDVITFSEAPPAGTDNIEVQVIVTIALGETDASLVVYNATTVEAQLDAVSAAGGSSLVGFQQAGTGAVVRTAQAKMREVVSVTDFMSVQDLADIASGTQSSSVRTAVQLAVDYINTVGGTLYFPPGHYNSPYLTHTDAANWLEITKSGVSFVADPGSVTLENFLFYVHGGYGAPQIVGAAGFTTGSTQINTAAAHGLSAGDYVQLLTGINPYTPDAGTWQLGSQNPTNLNTPVCRHAEIHRVFTVDSTTTATLYDNVIYSDYRDNTTGQSFPLPGVTGAEIRKLTPVIGVVFDGISFKNVDNSSFRGVVVRSAVDVTFNHCHFEAAGLAGAHVKSSDTLNLKFVGCTSYRSPTGASGSSWNSFFLGGCSQNVVFQDCHFVGEWQVIDVSPNLLSSDIGYTGDAIRAEYLTSQIISVHGCLFTKCSDGMTTHPATYNLNIGGNVFEGCSTGLRVRSKKNTISGNTFRTYRVGVVLSAFYEDTLIVGNNMEQLPQSVSDPWLGVSVVPMSSEIMNNNDVVNVVVSDNTFRAVQANAGNAGIQFGHIGNGVPPNGSFALFTDTIKTNLSAYLVARNRFIGCSARVRRWVNGITLSENMFSGGSDLTHYILCDNDSARNTLNLNLFRDATVPAFSVGTVSTPSFPYTTTHRIGYQLGDAGAPIGVTNNSTGLFMHGFGLPALDGVKVGNGGRIETVRSSGASTLRLDAVAQDGTSDVDIRVFDQNTTTGTKTLAVTGRVSSENSYPRTDEAYSSGLSSNRWSVIYAATGTINTSDAREKQQVRELSDAERAVAVRLKSLIRTFKFNEAVDRKGDGARIHVGVVAQDVRSAFEAEGLVAEDYAIFCYDTWDAELDEDCNIITPAGERYGVRYEELLAFMLAAL